MAWSSVMRACSCVALLLVMATACSGPQAGTQTNWLRSCEADAECGGALRCLCGTCTLPCEDDGASCSSLAGAACVAASEVGATALCGGSSPPTAGLCLARCDSALCPDGTACVGGVCAPLEAATDVVTVDVSTQHQTLVGFGADTGWLTDEIARHPAAAALYDALFADSGLNVVRLFNRFDDFGTSDLTTSQAILRAANQRSSSPAVLLLTSTSPPATLKANGSELCSGNLDTCTLARRADGSFDYPGFASHWRAVVEAYAAAGIEPDYISLQSDPDWIPPASIESDACRFLPAEGEATVDLNGTSVQVRYPGYVEALAAVKEQLGNLPSAPRIMAPDTRSIDAALTYASQVDLESVDAIAHHLYETETNPAERDALPVLNELGQRSGLPLFHTGVNVEGLETAITMHQALGTLGASIYLQNDLAVSAQLGIPNPTALVALTETGFVLQDPYHALRHFARETAPGWVRVGASSERGSVLVTAWQAPAADALTLVLVNPDATTITLQVRFGGWQLGSARVFRTVFPGVERFQELGALAPSGVITLPGQSVVTIAARAP